MTPFTNLYALYYDAMYAGKDYAAETEYILRAFREVNLSHGRLLSLGAGTLNYELLLAEKGYDITGVDLSADMVTLGKKKIGSRKNLSLEVADMRSLSQYPKCFDGALALFNVISYCRTADELAAVFNGVAKNLKLGGIFALDYWNGEAVLKSPPEDRQRTLTIQGRTLLRSTKVMSISGMEMELSIEIREVMGGSMSPAEIETHFVHGWDRSELQAIAARSGFKLRHESVFPEWDVPASPDRWALGAVFEKIS